MTQVAASPAGVSPLEPDAQAERSKDLESNLTPEEWLALPDFEKLRLEQLALEPHELEHHALEQFSLEAFLIDPNGPTARDDSSTSRDANERPAIDPRALADAYPKQSIERDFWEDVALVSERAALLQNDVPHALANSGVGTPHDHVTQAIAIVAAQYSLPADKRVSPASGSSPGAGPSRAEHVSHPQRPSSPDSISTELDFFDVVADLVGLEDLLGLTETGDVAGGVLAQTRDLAATALVAHETNRNSALKAAEGRKG
jgi:hypothetical protein